MFEDSIDQLEDKIDEQQCFGAVLRLGSYFNNITELFQLASYIRGKLLKLKIKNSVALSEKMFDVEVVTGLYTRRE